MLHCGLTQLLLAACASAAYVQWQHCDDYIPDAARFVPETLSASLAHVNDTHDRFSVRVGRRTQDGECAQWAAQIASARLDLDSLGRSSSYYSEVSVTCRTRVPGSNQSTLDLRAGAETRAFHTLSTFHVTVRLLGPYAEERGCLQANVTPELGPAVSATLRYAPSGILLFVLVVGAARSIRGAPISTDADAEAESDDAEAPPPPRALLPGVADCLQYLQFVFLTGSLSLFYPGFYQPAVSRLGWTSLFADGLVTHGQTYAAARDGIYEVNGTYGGTFGLELMTQVVGAPMTMDTWLNMVILAVAVAGVSAFGLQIHYWTRTRTRELGEEDGGTGLRSAFARTLRVVLSYFMLPLVALSFYQIDNAAHLPAYHISLAAIFIVAIILAFAWLLSRVPTRSLGVLIFEGRKRYRSIPSASSGDQHKSFVLALFTLVFVRGVAIGGLQISGPAQLAVLGACELILLACIVQFQAYGLLSVGTVSAVARLGSLICMVAFVPGVASDSARSAVGYLVLLVHLCMLALGFFAPAALQLSKICILWRNKPGPDVYGLRQLRRRSASRTDLPIRPSALSLSPDYITDQGNSRYLWSAHGQLDNASTSHFASPSVSSRDYYRPPRHSRISASPSTDNSRPSMASSLPESNPSTNSDSTEPHSSSYKASSSDSQRSNSSVPEVPSSAADPHPPLHPRWADYSFRESDLFYGVPPPLPAEQISESAAPRQSTWTLSPSRLWTRVVSRQQVSATEERGFSVVRPSRPPEPPPS